MLKLRLLTGPRAGRQLRISDTKPVSIGRRKGRLRLHDSRVSKNHAEIYFANDMWVLRDLGSANGTYINRKKVAGLVELESGDLVQMGRVLFKIVRCDGIGMDTQPALPDEWLGDDALGIGTAEAPAEEPAGDLDLEALFGGSESVDANDDSGIFAAADEPAVDADTDADELPSAGVLEQDEQVSEPIEAAFEEPVDDDDSFFADLGESTDTSGGADVAVSQALDDDNDAPVAEKLGDEGDPFVLEDADAAADAGDPAEALDPFLSGDEQEDPEGTGDLISLEDESGMGPRNSGTTLLTAVPHDDLINDESESSGPAIMDAEGEPGAKASEATEVEEDANDDDGLSPPLVGLHLDQAPPQQPETIGEEPAEPDTGAGASIDDDELGLQLDEPADEATVADLLVDEAPDDQPAAFEKVDDPEETPIDALAADEPIAEIDESAASSEDGVDAALGELDNSDESDDLTEELLAALDDDDATSDPLSVGDAQDSLAEEPGVTDEIADEPEPSASEASEEDPPEGAPVFDIDAAFDALSEGLDDSFEVPAIGADEVESQPADPAAADPLAGSQLDVGYIKDALSKLNEEQAESTDGLSDTSPKAAASPMDGGYIQSPPPGLNPSSLNPPEEPSKAYRPPGGAGRWFFTLLLFLTIGGAGVWYVSEHYDIQITGRDDAGPVTANASAPVVPGPADEAGSELPAAENVSTGAEPPPADEVFETRPSGPNPFASGSVVLGQEALDGITRGTSASPEPSPTLPPGATDAPGRADRVSSDPTPQPPRIEPQPVVIPGVDEDPAEPQPPARIVFLVDASGSLVDSLPQMLVWLNRAVQTIESDERFAIYFFKSGEPIGIKPEGMVTPTREVLNRINADWLSADRLPVFPSGRSNPTQAIAKALALEPTDIYFLSDDAFAFAQGDSTPQHAMGLVKAALGESDARVHGVQFFYRSDSSVLETLANETKGGTFEFVRERVVPNADPIDLLEEIGGE